MIRALLCGEGPGELGDWAREDPYRTDDRGLIRAGVVEVLARRLVTEGWEVADAIPWRRLRKYIAGGAMRRRQGLDREGRALAAAALHAEERGIGVVLYSRDRDGDTSREESLREGEAFVRREFASVEIGGGLAIECLEAWVLALLGESRSEGRSSANAQASLDVEYRGASAMANAAGAADLAKLPADALSLHRWLASVSAALEAAATRAS